MKTARTARKARLIGIAAIVTVMLGLTGLWTAAREVGLPAREPTILAGELGASDSFDVYVDGGMVHLLVGDNGAEGESPVFRHLRSSDGGATWSKPARVNAGDPAPVPHHRGSDARIVARGDRLFAGWTTPGTGFGGTGPMGTALSIDGGKTWRPAPNPADHDSRGSHRFLAFATARDAIHLVWLDDREKQRGLRHAASTDGGATWSANATIDPLVCACCWNTLHAGADGRLYVLYRDIKPSDMAIAVSGDNGATWRRLGYVGAFDWEFNGCPHVGGDITSVKYGANANGESDRSAVALFATVWTGREGAVGAYLYRSDNGGEKWTQVMQVGGRGARNAMIAAQNQAVAVVWDEYVQDHKTVFIQRSTDGGRTWLDPRPLSPAGSSATHPRVIPDPVNGGFRVFWTRIVERQPAVLVTRAVP